MACKCNELTTVLRCKSCGHIQTIAHSKEENPLEKAKTENRVCKKCYSTEWVEGGTS